MIDLHCETHLAQNRKEAPRPWISGEGQLGATSLKTSQATDKPTFTRTLRAVIDTVASFS